MKIFEALSEHSNGSEYSAIERGSFKACVKACGRDDSPCYVVEILTYTDGDEIQSCDILFVNKAWNRKHTK